LGRNGCKVRQQEELWVKVVQRSGVAVIRNTLHPGRATLKVALIRITIMKEVTSVRLRFIGQDGSMGLKFGEIYQASVETKRDGTTQMTRPVICPYASDEAFARNWADPRMEVRSVMEALGR
jgi:hypothetical protein